MPINTRDEILYGPIDINVKEAKLINMLEVVILVTFRGKGVALGSGPRINSEIIVILFFLDVATLVYSLWNFI